MSAEARVSRPYVIAYPTTEFLADYATSSATKQTLIKAIKPSDEDLDPMKKWQRRWDKSSIWRHLHQLFPSVIEDMARGRALGCSVSYRLR